MPTLARSAVFVVQVGCTTQAIVLTRSLYMPIVIGTILLCGFFAVLGVLLVHLGGKGASQIRLFGQSIETPSVGLASMFLGAIVVMVVLLQVIKATSLFLAC